MVATLPPDAAGAFALLAVAADPEATRARLEKLTEQMAAVSKTNDETRELANAAKADRAAAEIALDQAKEQQDKNRGLDALRASINEKAEDLKDRITESDRRERAYNAVCAARDADLKRRETDLVTKQDALTVREAEIEKREKALAELEASHNERIEKLKALVAS